MLRFATILILGLSVPLGAAMAQNAPAAKEQDVNDFKLDKPAQTPTGPSDPTPSAQPDSKPPVKAPTQVVFQPATQPTDRPKTEQPKTVTPVKKAAEVKAETKTAPEKAKDRKAAAPAAAILATPPTSSDAPGVDTILNDIAPAPETGKATTAPEATQKPGSNPLVPGLIGAAVIGILGLLMWLWSRRRRAVAQDFDEVAAVPAPESPKEVVPVPVAPEIIPIAAEVVSPVPDPEPEPEIKPEIVDSIPAPVAAAVPMVKPEPITTIASNTSDIKLTFVPERIVISFNSLSLYGDLEVHNTGATPAHNVKLYTGLITANADQNAEMTAFHAGQAGVDPDDLDNMAAGEKIALSLSLALPLTEIQSYVLGNQQLTVPIMLARVSHVVDGSNTGKVAEQVQTLSCIIGREAVPPQPKMGPLRLDMGPRSYASLGQRSIAA